MSGVEGRSGRPTKYRVAQREKFLEMAIEELNSLLISHREGKNVLEPAQLIALCQPMIMKEMANKVEIDNLNDLTGEQKYNLMIRYMETLPSANRPAITS